MDNSPDWADYVAVLALVVSTVALFLQFIRVKGAQVRVLEASTPDSKPQTSGLLTYAQLPPSIRNEYPEYPGAAPYYALVRVPFANEGDRQGYAKVLDVAISPPHSTIRPTYYSYAVVPAYGITLHTILLTRLEGKHQGQVVELTLHVELTGLPRRLLWGARPQVNSAHPNIRVQLTECIIPAPGDSTHYLVNATGSPPPNVALQGTPPAHGSSRGPSSSPAGGAPELGC